MTKIFYVLMDLLFLRGLRFLTFYLISGFDIELSVEIMYYEVISFIIRGVFSASWRDAGYQNELKSVNVRVNLFLIVLFSIVLYFSSVNGLALIFGLVASYYDSLVFNTLNKSLILSKFYESIPLLILLAGVFLVRMAGYDLDIELFFIIKMIIPVIVLIYNGSFTLSLNVRGINLKNLMSGILFFILITVDRRIYAHSMMGAEADRFLVILIYMSSVIVSTGKLISDILFTLNGQRKTQLLGLIFTGVILNTIGLIICQPAVQIFGNAILLSIIAINRHLFADLVSQTQIGMGIIVLAFIYALALTGIIMLGWMFFFTMIIISYVVYLVQSTSSQHGEATL